MAALMRRLRRRSERGAELVEFAIILPLLLLLMAGIVDFALLFHSYQVTTNAAREGARLAMLPGYDQAGYATALARIDNYITTGGASGAYTRTITPVTVPLGGGLMASGVTATVTYSHNFLLIGPVVGLFNGTFDDTPVTYTTGATMRTELQGVVGP
jgi:Flp pilus assembly protein TadG